MNTTFLCLTILPIVWVGTIFFSRWFAETTFVQILRHEVKGSDAIPGGFGLASLITAVVAVGTAVLTDNDWLIGLSMVGTSVCIGYGAFGSFNRWPSKKLQAFDRDKELGLIKYGDQVDECPPRSVFIVRGPI